jgi:histone-lysine N-methyltransferase SETMAR
MPKTKTVLLGTTGYIILHHNNAPPYTAHLTSGRTENTDWEVLPHPPYSLDLAHSD